MTAEFNCYFFQVILCVCFCKWCSRWFHLSVIFDQLVIITLHCNVMRCNVFLRSLESFSCKETNNELRRLVGPGCLAPDWRDISAPWGDRNTESLPRGTAPSQSEPVWSTGLCRGNVFSFIEWDPNRGRHWNRLRLSFFVAVNSWIFVFGLLRNAKCTAVCYLVAFCCVSFHPFGRITCAKQIWMFMCSAWSN